PWLREHNFFDENGNLIDFTSHTFRHAFATYALKGGASIEVISELMNHKSIRGTKHYTHLLQEDIKNRFAEVLNEGAVISDKKALQIKDKLKELQPFKGKTVEQVDKQRKAMKEGPFESKLKHMEKYLIEIINDLENQLNYKGKNDNTKYKAINS